MSKLPKTTLVNFPENQYYKKEFKKTQIYLHHTAGNPDGKAVFRWWTQDKQGRIATCVSISGKGKNTNDGEIIQGYSSKFWAYHLGVKSKFFAAMGLPYKELDKISIGVEICNWGQLTKRGDKFYNYVKGEVPANEVCELEKPYKGYKYYHNYTDAQIESTKQLLLYWGKFYDIPLDYNEDIWDLTPRAYKGEAGIFTHNSVRPDKVDIYPHPKMIEMLKSLKIK
jgi:N-acetyl-anhydromuramyl-L-alanine amidase AmpD